MSIVSLIHSYPRFLANYCWNVKNVLEKSVKPQSKNLRAFMFFCAFHSTPPAAVATPSIIQQYYNHFTSITRKARAMQLVILFDGLIVCKLKYRYFARHFSSFHFMY